MRYAILSDVHANREALVAVLSWIKKLEGVDQILCLGDVVGYHTSIDECIELLVRHDCASLLGNHDRASLRRLSSRNFGPFAKAVIRWTRRHLSNTAKAFLAGLPTSRLLDGSILLVHGAVHPIPNDRIHLSNFERIKASFRVMSRRAVSITFFGHTHVPAVYEQKGSSISLLDAPFRLGACDARGDRALPPASPAAERLVDPSRSTMQPLEHARRQGHGLHARPLRDADTVQCQDIELDPSAQYLINPGSVGEPRDSDPRASVLLFNTVTHRVKFYRVPYDRASQLRVDRARGLPSRRGLLSAMTHLTRDTLLAKT